MNGLIRPSAKELALRIRQGRLTPPPVESPVELKGYVRSSAAAAAYCGVDRKTFRSWRDDKLQAQHLRRLLQPRIIRGESYYRLANLDRFMDPVNNIADEPMRGAHLLA